MEWRLLGCIFMVELLAGRKSCSGFLYQLVHLLEELLSSETRSDFRKQTFRSARKIRNVVKQSD